MELCGFTLVREVGSIHRPEHANRQNKRLNGQADRLNGFSGEISATRNGQAEETKRPVLAQLKPIVCEAFGGTRSVVVSEAGSAQASPRPHEGAGTHSAPSFAETTGAGG